MHSHHVIALFGEDIARWSTDRSMGAGARANQDADAMIDLATSSAPAAQHCIRGQLEGCRTLLTFDTPLNSLGPARGGGYTINRTRNHMRERLLAIVLRVGGPEAPQRFRVSSAALTGQRFAESAGIPADSLLAIWRTDLMQRRLSPLSPGIGNLGALLLVTLALGFISLRRPSAR